MAPSLATLPGAGKKPGYWISSIWALWGSSSHSSNKANCGAVAGAEKDGSEVSLDRRVVVWVGVEILERGRKANAEWTVA